MPEPINPADESVLQRRRFLRGSALLAAAAGGAVVATATSAVPASADVANYLALTIGIPSERLLDTRTEDGRKAIVGSSTSALDSKNRLKKGAWIDVAVGPADTTDGDLGTDVPTVFATVTSRSSTKGGSLTVSQPGEKPTGRTLSFDKGKTVSTGTVVGTGIQDEVYVIRVWTTATGHVTLDLTGVVLVRPQDDSAPDVDARSGVARVQKMVRAARR